MQYLRIYSDAKGETHFEEVKVETTVQQSTVSSGVSALSALIPTTGVIFRQVVREAESDKPHRAPRRQFVVHLAGESEVEVSDGEVRRIRPGEVVLADDTTGKGHITRGVGDGDRITLFLPLAEQAAPR